MISPATAQQIGLTSGDYVTLQLAGREAKAGVFIVPGHADNSVTVHLGYGRSRGGQIGTGPGFNANLLRGSESPWMALGLKIAKTGKTFDFASVQHQYNIDFEGHPGDTTDFGSDTAFRRDLVQIGTLDDFRKDPAFAQNESNQVDYHGPSLYPNFKYDGYAWGMSIDLNRCVGCNACVVACQSENNISVVGKDQVARGRSMHWIRIDTYFRGGLDNPEVYYEPLPCMQCENAPCEYVCPVGATTHSPEGLNDMTYNRCVGTRYCSNNCPYKVRRFNFYLYSDYTTPSLFGVRNPERDRALPRSDGKVHLLRAAHQRGENTLRGGRPHHTRRRNRHCVPAGLPRGSDRFRQHQRSQQPRVEAQSPDRATTDCWWI